MKTRVWVYLVVGVLSVGAGVAIAGTPNSVPRQATIPVPATTEAPRPTAPEAATPSEPPSTTGPDGTDTTSTSPTLESTTTESVSTPATAAPPLPDRAQVGLSVVNGANIGGVATRAATALEELGYVDVGWFDGIDIVDVSVVYASDGSQAVADRVAGELGVASGLALPIAEMSPVDGLDDPVVVVYLGRDADALSLFG